MPASRVLAGEDRSLNRTLMREEKFPIISHVYVPELPRAESRMRITDRALILNGENDANIAEKVVPIALPRFYFPD